MPHAELNNWAVLVKNGHRLRGVGPHQPLGIILMNIPMHGGMTKRDRPSFLLLACAAGGEDVYRLPDPHGNQGGRSAL